MNHIEHGGVNFSLGQSAKFRVSRGRTDLIKALLDFQAVEKVLRDHRLKKLSQVPGGLSRRELLKRLSPPIGDAVIDKFKAAGGLNRLVLGIGRNHWRRKADI